MDWNDTPEQSAFRQDVRTFIDTKVPPRYERDARGFGSRYDWMEDRKDADP